MVEISRARKEDMSEETSTQDMIRSAIIAELDATSIYQQQIENIRDAGAIRVLKHIRDEEKEHISELMCLLESIDSTQKDKLYKQYPQLKGYAEQVGEDCIIK